jgi:glycosyltransferase involved in cell wall biosynthesis
VFLDLLLARELLKVLRRKRVDVIHTHNIEGLLIGLFARCRTGVPVVYHVHNLMGPELHTYFDSRLGRWIGRVVGRWVDRYLPQRADCCIALSSKAARELRELGVSRERIWGIPPGIAFDGRRGVDDPERGAVLGAGYGLESGPMVLYTGNLDRYQDIDLLLEAFQRVASQRSNVQLVIATHSDNGFRHKRAARAGLWRGVHLIVLRDLAALHDLLNMSDVVVSPRTVCFGFPIKILNYMAAGKPIVASEGSAQGLRHMENGWVVPNGDKEAFAQAILTLLEDRTLAHRLGANAQETAAQAYTWDRAVGGLENMYKSLTEG